MPPTLVIVQDQPTQFDVPLYDFLHRNAPFGLHIIYTASEKQAYGSFDHELGRHTQWDHIKACQYPHSYLSLKNNANTEQDLLQAVLAQQPTLVVICGYSPLAYARLAWRLKKRKIRIGLRSDNTLHHSSFNGIKGLFKSLFLPIWLRNYDTWHPVGSLARNYLETVARVQKPTFLFPYAIDNEWFFLESEKSRLNRAALRSKLGIAYGDFVILGILKWTKREDPLTLIDAFTILLKTYSSAKLILVGTGPMREMINNKAASLGVSMICPGYVPYSELPKYFAISDVFVHPAIGEPWGVSVNEAMACGLPVITAESVGAATNLIINWDSGFIYPDRDSTALAQCLKRLVHKNHDFILMKEKALARISEWSYNQSLCEFQKSLMEVSRH